MNMEISTSKATNRLKLMDISNIRILRTISLNSRQQWVMFSKIRRVHFSFYELNNDNGDFQIVKTIRMFMIQITNIKSDDHIYLKLSLRMQFFVARNEIVQWTSDHTLDVVSVIHTCMYLQLSSPTQNSISRI